jgi:hypothetical protein
MNKRNLLATIKFHNSQVIHLLESWPLQRTAKYIDNTYLADYSAIQNKTFPHKNISGVTFSLITQPLITFW